MNKLLLVLLLSMFSVSAFAEETDCYDVKNLNLEQAKQCMVKTETELNNTYGQLITRFKTFKNGSDTLLETSQKGWVTSRDANCEIVTLNTTTDKATGSSAPLSGLICKLGMNKVRNEFFSLFL